ncbi:MAG: hypothetical protein DRP00_04430 [Candidatus Aenigmatarchaeota archaeon]|nr:MAG: hypothetical protein DRP00_04430 [Candidatus Aenigmarchaeota archaeon]
MIAAEGIIAFGSFPNRLRASKILFSSNISTGPGGAIFTPPLDPPLLIFF